MQKPPLPECQICRKKHLGVYNKVNILCYKCNQKGHYANKCQNQKAGMVCFKCGNVRLIAKDCKAPAPVNNMLRLKGPPSTSNQLRARTFNMIMRDTIQNMDVVAGTLSINSISSKVLIDSGTTKSFISQEFAHRLNYETQVLPDALTIEIANQDRVPINRVCPHLQIDILGHHYYVN